MGRTRREELLVSYSHGGFDNVEASLITQELGAEGSSCMRRCQRGTVWRGQGNLRPAAQE